MAAVAFSHTDRFQYEFNKTKKEQTKRTLNTQSTLVQINMGMNLCSTFL